MATSTASTTASSPDKSPPNANSEPPTSSNLTTPPPPLPASPPPTSPPPLALPSPPPPNLSPPPVSAPPPTSMASPPPPLSASPPPPAAVPPSPPTSSSPPITVPPPAPSKPSPSTQLPSNSSAATPPPRNMPAHYPSPPGNPSLPPPPTNPSSSMTPPARPLATPSNPSIYSNSSLDTNRPLVGSHSSGGGNKTGAAVGITIAISFVMLTFLGLAVWFARKRKKQVGGHVGSFVMSSSLLGASQISEASLVKSNSASHGFPYSSSVPDLGYSKSRFTYEELSDATDGFLTQNLLGEGGFGCVYKGRMPDGREVAVKQLKVGGGQGEREFSAEVEIIGRIHHRHLVSLVGYCILDHQRLLVYDYVPNNTLYYHLHGEGELLMDWSTRVKVAAGAARGISYLHEDCHPRIIHRDIKSSNILLDKNFEAQVSDFGLAKLALDADTHITTRVMGTFGYLAPEYASSGKLTDKSDVYSFGVVLLELVTGRKPVDSFHPLGDEGLVEWARPLMAHTIETGDFEDLPDPRLKKDYNKSEMFRMIDVAAACVRHSASMRPRMGQVVRALDGLADSLDLHNGIKPGQSELFNSAQESAEIRLFRRMAFGNQDFSTDFSWSSQRDW